MQTEIQTDNIFGELISSYSRAQAIEDGELVDVTDTAKEAGISFPVALTRAVWNQYVEIPKGVKLQDESGRLWDIVWMLRLAARRSSSSVIGFIVLVRNNNRSAKPVRLKAICGPGDNAEPVITVMLEHED